jgi:hypothetical protein
MRGTVAVRRILSRRYSWRRAPVVVSWGGPIDTRDKEQTVATDWVAKINETAQEHVPEPVVATGILQPAGTWGSFGLDQVSGVASMFKRRKSNKGAGGLAKTSWKGTKTVLLAVTGEKLYAFACKQKGRNWKIEDQLGEWSRSDLKVETTPGKLSTKVVFDVEPTGEHYELEATTVGSAGFNDPFLAAIAA